MCPLRFVLLFFSAILAGYFAWRSFGSSDDNELLNDAISDDLAAEKSASSKVDKQEKNITMIVQDGFWLFVDMASGRYLWRNLKGMNAEQKVKSL